MCQEMDNHTAKQEEPRQAEVPQEEPKALGFRSLHELKIAFNNRSHHQEPRQHAEFRRLAELQRGFEQRRRQHSAAAEEEAKPAVLESKQERVKDAPVAAAKAKKVAASAAPSFRPLEELTREFRLRKGGAAAAAEGQDSAAAAAPAGADRAYSREEMLLARSALLGAGRLRHAPRGFHIGTVAGLQPAPAPQQARGLAWGADAEEDPNLDDEDILGQLEARLSRESGADAKNVETFGATAAGAGGWSFEAAVEANERLLALGAGPAADPAAVRDMVREVYSATIAKLGGVPEGECQPHPPRLGGGEFVAERCPSTAAPSGAATPVGSAASARETSPAGSARDSSACAASRLQEAIAVGAGGICFQ